MESRKSQLDKFNARMARKNEETRMLAEQNAKKALDKPAHYGDANKESVEELMEQGSIREAAAVFSHEGMSIFAKMFSNSVEDAINKALVARMEQFENRLESLVQNRMLQMLEGMTQGIQNFATQQVSDKLILNAMQFGGTSSGSIKSLKEAVEEQGAIDDLTTEFKETLPVMDNLVKFSDNTEDKIEEQVRLSKLLNSIEEEEPVTKPKGYSGTSEKAREELRLKDRFIQAYRELTEEDAVSIDLVGLDLKPKKSRTKIGTNKDDMLIIEPYLMSIFKKYEGKVVKSSDISRLFGSECNLTMVNFTVVLSKLSAKYPSLQKIGFGLYLYEEKTFHPTI